METGLGPEGLKGSYVSRRWMTEEGCGWENASFGSCRLETCCLEIRCQDAGDFITPSGNTPMYSRKGQN